MRPPVLLATAAAVASLLLPGVGRTADDLFIGGEVTSLLEFARQHHPEFAAARHEAAAATARVESAGALPDPVLRTELRDPTNEANPAASPNLLPARIGGAKYTVSQSLPWFGKRELRRELAAAGASEADTRARATWLELATRIKRTYAEHHVHLATLRLLHENVDLLTRVAEIARVRYANGIGTQQDVLRAQTERALLLGEVAVLEGESVQAGARMRNLLGRPPDSVKLRPPERLRPLPPPARLDFATLEARLLANSPQLAVETARIVAAGKNRDLVQRNRYPDVNVGIAPIQVGTRVAEWEVMVEVNIPLQQDSRRAQEREAARLADAALARREAARNQALADLGEGLAALEAARRIETLLAGSLLPQAELALQSALAGYETGRIDFAMVQDAQRQVRKVRQDLVRTRGDQQVRMAGIEQLIGEDL